MGEAGSWSLFKLQCEQIVYVHMVYLHKVFGYFS